MELTFEQRKHFGTYVWESNEMVTDELNIEHPRFRITKEDDVYVVREKDQDYQGGYRYTSNTLAENKLKDTIYWLNVNLHRI